MYIADLHIHSRYSRATSKDCTPEHLDLWARRKGIHIVGTGDFTHPAWRQELEEKLEPDENGLYKLKSEYRIRGEGAPDGAGGLWPGLVAAGGGVRRRAAGRHGTGAVFLPLAAGAGPAAGSGLSRGIAF